MQDSVKRRAARVKLWYGALFAFVIMAGGLYYFPSHEEKTAEPAQSSIAVQRIKLPPFFEKNEDQADGSVKYLTFRQEYSFYFNPREIVMVLQPCTNGEQRNSPFVLKMSFAGDNPNPMIAGLEEAMTNTNCFE